MPIRGKSKCVVCNKNAHGGTHCRKCTMHGGGTASYGKTEAQLQRERTQAQRLAARQTAAAKKREEKHIAAINKAAAAKEAKRAAAAARAAAKKKSK